MNLSRMGPSVQNLVLSLQLRKKANQQEKGLENQKLGMAKGSKMQEIHVKVTCTGPEQMG